MKDYVKDYDLHDSCPNGYCSECAPELAQIVPSTGWIVWYVNPDGTTFVSPVILWGLRRDGITAPLTVGGDGDVKDPTDDQNFVAITQVWESAPPPQMLKQAIERMARLSEP